MSYILAPKNGVQSVKLTPCVRVVMVIVTGPMFLGLRTNELFTANEPLSLQNSRLWCQAGHALTFAQRSQIAWAETFS